MAFPTTPLLDTFFRAPEMPLNQTNWRDVFGIVVNTNQANASADGPTMGASWWNTTFGPDCDVYVFIPTIDVGITNQARVGARCDPSTENGYFVNSAYFGGGGADHIVLIRGTGGIPAILATYHVTLADGDGIGLRCEGNNISVYHYTLGAWNLLGTTADATYPGAGVCGTQLWVNSAGTGAIPIENFGAGNETGAAFPEPGVLDNFNRPNEGPPPSSSWVDQYVMGVVGMRGAARQTANDYTIQMSWRTAFAQDQEAYVTVPVRQVDGNSIDILSRYQSIDNMIGVAIARDDGGVDAVAIYEVVAGVNSLIGGPYVITYQDGDAFGVQCIGGNIEAWYKPIGGVWTSLGSCATTLPLAGGHVGLVAYDTTVRFSDFGGGNYSGGEETPFPSCDVVDHFDGPNQGPPPNVNWGISLDHGLITESNVCRASHAGALFDVQGSYWLHALTPDCDVYATVAEKPYDDGYMYIAARMNATYNTYYVLALSPASAGCDNYNIIRVVGGVSTTLLTGCLPGVLTVGESFGIRCYGSIITAYRKAIAGSWTALGSIADVAIAAGGFAALMNESDGGLGGGGAFDDFGACDYVPPTPSGIGKEAVGTTCCAKNVHRIVPEVVSGYILDEAHGFFSLVTPIGTTNEISNPSAETGLTGYVAGLGAMARSAVYQTHGVYSIMYTPAVVLTDGMYYLVSLTAGVHTFSVDVLANPGYKLKLVVTDAAGTAVLAEYVFVAIGRFTRPWVAFTAPANASYRLYVSKNNTVSTGTYYTDGWQCEPSSYPTTYCDGDMKGFVTGRIAYRWLGTPHASHSTRSAQTKSGGKVVSFRELGFDVMAYQGLGHEPVENLAMPLGLVGGSQYQNTLPRDRVFATAGTFMTRDFKHLMRLKRDMLDAINMDAVAFKQPLVIRYQAVVSGLPLSDVVELKCLYVSGLEGMTDNLHQERVGIQWVMYAPAATSVNNKGGILGFTDTLASADYIMMRDIDGQWQLMGVGLDGTPRCMIVGPDSNLYVGGDFHNAGGVLVNHIARWDGTAWYALGLGTGGPVRALAFDSAGNLYVGGDFVTAGGAGANNIAMWDGANWSALGAGVDDVVYAIAVTPSYVYAGGEFANAGGAPAACIAYWDIVGTAWNPMGAGMAIGAGTPVVYTIAVGLNGDIYAGGDFDTAGGVTVNDIAQWNGATWAALDTGTDAPGDYVQSIVIHPNGTLYAGGAFAAMSGVTVNNIAQWNGVGWQAMSVGLGSYVYAMYMDAEGNLYINGAFATAGGFSIPDCAIWNGSSYVGLDGSVPLGSANFCGAIAPDGTLYQGFNANDDAPVADITVVNNVGTVYANPKITITGPGALRQLTNYTTGDIMWFNVTLLAGESLVIDTQTGSVTSSFRGNMFSAVLRGSNMVDWKLIKGNNNVALFIMATDANTAAKYTYTPAYHSLEDVVR